MYKVQNMIYDFEMKIWETVSEEAKNLISKMLVFSEDRITIPEILKHPWMLQKDSQED